MVLTEIRPLSDENFDIDDIISDLDYDWVVHRRRYTTRQLNEMETWITSKNLIQTILKKRLKSPKSRLRAFTKCKSLLSI